jgi:hypothetical protein
LRHQAMRSDLITRSPSILDRIDQPITWWVKRSSTTVRYNHSLMGANIGDIGCPDLIKAGDMEVLCHMIRRDDCGLPAPRFTVFYCMLASRLGLQPLRAH